MTGEQEQCDDSNCGFVWAAVGASEVAPRLRDACAAIARLLRSGEEAAKRPTPDVWSPIEYACHVRDVLLNLRDRVVVAINEDNPAPKGMYGWPVVADRTIVWVAAQALHEAPHHLADISRAAAVAADHR